MGIQCFPTMNTHHGDSSQDLEQAQSAEHVADLLGVVAGNDLSSAVGRIEAALAELRSRGEAAARSKAILSQTPAPLLREGIRLRAARQELS